LEIVEKMIPEVGTCLFNFPRAINNWQKCPDYKKILQIYGLKPQEEKEEVKAPKKKKVKVMVVDSEEEEEESSFSEQIDEI